MTTINGVTFNMRDLEVVATHRNVPNEQPGSDESFINDMGYAGLVLRITGFEETLAKYDEVISEFMKTGAQTLVYRTGWQFFVYSTRLVPMLDIGIVDNWFPYELIMITSTPYRESTTLYCLTKKITADNEEWTTGNYCDNLLENWSFETWSGGSSVAPDGWTLLGGAIAKETGTVKIGGTSAKGTFVGVDIGLYNSNSTASSFYLPLRSKTLTFGCWLYSSTSLAFRLRLGDNYSNHESSYHTGGGGWEFLTVTHTINSTATEVEVLISPNNAGVVYIDGAILVEEDSLSEYTGNIETDGSVDAVPDIQVTGGLGGGYVVDINQSSQNGTSILTSGNTMGQTFIPAGNSLEKVSIYIASMVGFPMNLTMRIFDSVAMTNELGSDTISTGVTLGEKIFTFDPVIDIGNKDLMYFRFDSTSGATSVGLYKSTANPYSGGAQYISDVIQASNDLQFRNWTIKTKVKDPVVYNTADTTVKCAIANDVLHEAIHRINTDGTGTIEYSDDFSTGKYRYDGTNVNCSCDDTNNELDIADDGYIYWKCDTKGPVTGIPTLTSHINITAGLPTIQISIDASTWYDITTAIVDDVDTVYELDSSSLHLKEVGATEFYWRFDCVKAAAATCSIKSFELDVDIVTIDFEHPVIDASGVSTFRCDQDAASGLDCEIAFFFRSRSWPA